MNDHQPKAMEAAMNMHVKIESLILFYAIYMVGLVLWVTSPLMSETNWSLAVVSLLSLVVGVVLLSTSPAGRAWWGRLDGWSVMLTLVDILWSTVVILTAAGAGFYGAQLMAN